MQVVLVGDPKQLPATLFSRSARDTAMDRSLFERLASVRPRCTRASGLFQSVRVL